MHMRISIKELEGATSSSGNQKDRNLTKVVLPGEMSPSCSAFSIMLIAILSFTLRKI